MILGRFYSQLSPKGRLAIPSKFRKETGNRIIIARWYENCLVIVGLSYWKSLLRRLTSGNEVVIRPIRSVERFILSTAFEVETDSQGRFVVPVSLRDQAKITGEVVFLGLGERIELWDRSLWEEEEKKVEKEADQSLLEISQNK